MKTGSLQIRLDVKQNSEVFMDIWEWFVALKVRPSYIYSDHGSQLVKDFKSFVNMDDSEYRSELWSRDKIKSMIPGT